MVYLERQHTGEGSEQDFSGRQSENRLCLVALPPEVLINIFSHVDEKDLYVLQQVCSYFSCLINDEELWKNLFVSKIHTSFFPSFAQSHKYSVEYMERVRGLKQWKHNRAIKTKYVLSPSPRFQAQIEKLIFDYPRCACYNDGIITLVQLHSRRKKDRLIYIPCTTPQGCSTMSFNINAAVFGRFDGRVFGKLLSNKSYLTPVTEFDARHSSCVTAITTSVSQDSLEDWCVSGSESGDLIWWCETHMVNSLKISSKVILQVALYKNWTVALDIEKVYVIRDMKDIYKITLPKVKNSDGMDMTIQVQFQKVDFGSMSLVIADTRHIFVISLNPEGDFGRWRSMFVSEGISNLEIDAGTSRREQNKNLAGQDGCYVAIMTVENSIKILNIRAPGNNLKVENDLRFDEHIFTCQISNLVLVCALSGQLQIFDAAGATLIKTVQKTDKYPQLLAISQGKMVIGSGNVIHFLEYTPDASYGKKRRGSGLRGHSNKWERRVDAELALYDEEESLRRKKAVEHERLLETYGGDLSDDELQLRIALMESETSNEPGPGSTRENDEDADLKRAIEESQRMHQNQRFLETFADEEDDEFLEALERSSTEQRQVQGRSLSRRTPRIMDGGRNDTGSNETYQPHVPDDDEALQLALALSLSEMR
ncbi:hypothetical protein HG536_0H00320 [Torulaspora globosa]|uniref:F-box domain-containing protein n=1 Tax=Torulaspora globosa TaxID=48254 RepID=A0A7G3ZMC2_9SACH|nr:uncharacterized protein HG536_0H00320 [Torulaspora globosa]QLL34658.1 hypothetical protein HG536_0H00320 [Torulaspora globosa]